MAKRYKADPEMLLLGLLAGTGLSDSGYFELDSLSWTLLLLISLSLLFLMLQLWHLGKRQKSRLVFMTLIATVFRHMLRKVFFACSRSFALIYFLLTDIR